MLFKFIMGHNKDCYLEDKWFEVQRGKVPVSYIWWEVMTEIKQVKITEEAWKWHLWKSLKAE